MHTRLILTALLLLLPLTIFAQLEYTATTQFEMAVAEKEESEFLENWTDLGFTYQNWRLGGRYEIHEPFASFAQQVNRQLLSHYYLEYRQGGFSARAGTFFSLLGRGLVLRTFENRTLRWDSNIEGAKLDYRHKRLDVQVLYGKARDTRELDDNSAASNRGTETPRTPAFAAGELKLKPVRLAHFGGTYLRQVEESGDSVRFQRGSVYSELFLNNVSIYGEFARSEDIDREGEAFFLSSNISFDALSLLIEYRNYDNFSFFGGKYNNPPTVYREHLFTLMNRAQKIQDANSEQGFMLEAAYPLLEDGYLLANVSLTDDQAGDQLYQDIYLQFDKDEFAGGEWSLAAGRQEDVAARSWNIAGSASFDISDQNSLKTTYEHQHTKDNFDRQYYTQLLTLGLSHSPGWTLSFLGEHSTDQFEADDYELGDGGIPHSFWGALQLDVNLFERFDLTVFGGSRRKGKVCIGGVCVVKPELQGVEFTLIGRL